MSISLFTTDILVLGSGLSGLKAACVAKEQAPHLNITLACIKKGPTGSSFTNRNDALGIQLLDTDERCDAFVDEAISLGRPGFINPSLVQLLASDGEIRFRELEALKLDFRRLENGTLARYSGCGSSHRRAVIFTNLHTAFNRFIGKTVDCGVNILTNIEILGIISRENHAYGAWGRNHSDQKPIAINARCVIAALGGPAPLFTGHQSGSGVPGISYGILKEAGAALENTAYLQYMWGLKDKSFQNPATLIAPGHALITKEDQRLSSEHAFGKQLESLREARATHCPAFYHRPQSKLDQWLMDSRHDEGFTHIDMGDSVLQIKMSAHAGNGGAIVDANSETSIFNLFAVGECATGMHGANRMGGAMVLATQVFGHRAGIAAAQRALHVPFLKKQEFGKLCGTIPAIMKTLGTDRKSIAFIRNGMAQFAQFGGQPGINKFREKLKLLRESPDRLVQLAAESALEASRPLTIPATATQ